MRKSPKFLNLFKIHLPITGLVSIMHRLSGLLNIFLFLGIIYLYWLLPQGNDIDEILVSPIYLVLMWLAISAFFYHFLAGMRHIYMDFSHEHRLGFARHSSLVVLGLSVLFAIWVGVSL
ncbi:succinate dehydrogenase, cytochrome b556 subunit [Gammaproteobacteria bacterium]|nr:succinate dehydrogenase, cytochrome b556 subunit [Gammaproteobacteria bacterium]